jgi:hypothetical protein
LDGIKRKRERLWLEVGKADFIPKNPLALFFKKPQVYIINRG